MKKVAVEARNVAEYGDVGAACEMLKIETAQLEHKKH
jgi:hypothetical protein